MSFKTPESIHGSKVKIPYKFRIYRMLSTIWYNEVLDQEMISLLQHAVADQMEQIHESIINHMIYEGPKGDIEVVRIILKVRKQPITI